MSDDLYRVKGMPEDEKDDHIVRAVALGGHVKAVAIRSKAIVSEAQKIHNTSSVVTAALGRFLTGSLLIAENMKNEDDTQTTIIRADGPIGGMTCVCDSKDTSGDIRSKMMSLRHTTSPASSMSARLWGRAP